MRAHCQDAPAHVLVGCISASASRACPVWPEPVPRPAANEESRAHSRISWAGGVCSLIQWFTSNRISRTVSLNIQFQLLCYSSSKPGGHDYRIGSVMGIFDRQPRRKQWLHQDPPQKRYWPPPGSLVTMILATTIRSVLSVISDSCLEAQPMVHDRCEAMQNQWLWASIHGK